MDTKSYYEFIDTYAPFLRKQAKKLAYGCRNLLDFEEAHQEILILAWEGINHPSCKDENARHAFVLAFVFNHSTRIRDKISRGHPVYQSLPERSEAEALQETIGRTIKSTDDLKGKDLEHQLFLRQIFERANELLEDLPDEKYSPKEREIIRKYFNPVPLRSKDDPRPGAADLEFCSKKQFTSMVDLHWRGCQRIIQRFIGEEVKTNLSEIRSTM